jgi:ornithine decarboxylase
MVFTQLNEAGIELRMLNLGGGFPAHYRRDVPALEAYADAINRAVERHFGNRMPQLIIEPGRGMTGDAGIIQSEVVLISEKGYHDKRRWVFLDIGKFGGLAETMDESIQYRIRTPHDGGETAPVVLAGPTCDSADVLYDKADYKLPTALRIGDKIEIHATGAYTTSYSAVGFNGFPPLSEHYI